MTLTTTRPTPQVSDLVLDPFAYSDRLAPRLRAGLLDHDEADHLACVLPTAIAQLDAVGDAYGAIALACLYEQLAHLPVLA